MNISSAIGLGLTLAIVGAGGYGIYTVLKKRGPAYMQPGGPSPYLPPVATVGPNAAPPAPKAPTPQDEAKAWIGVADDAWNVAGDIIGDIRGWAN